MPSQYDAIGSKYDMIKRTSFNRIEQLNFRKHVSPFLQKANANANVLDLACGTGFYSHLLLSWGAASLVGVDLSPVMVEAAAARLGETPYAQRAAFQAGDGFNLDSIKNLFYQNRMVGEQGEQGEANGFDVVTGVWFLNYAKDAAELANGFRNIASCLKPNGVMVAVCPNPVEDIDALATSINAGPLPPTGVIYNYPRKLENAQGYVMDVKVQPPPSEPAETQPLHFSGLHLRKSLWEEAARAGGMQGRLEWKLCEFPEDMHEDTDAWRFLRKHPQMAVLIVYKE